MSASGQGDAGAKALSDPEEAISINLIADGERVQIVNASGERCADGVARVVGVAGERVEQDAGGTRAFELCGPGWERLGCTGELRFFGPDGSRVRSFDYGHDVASRELNVVAQGGEGGDTPSQPAFSSAAAVTRDDGSSKPTGEATGDQAAALAALEARAAQVVVVDRLRVYPKAVKGQAAWYFGAGRRSCHLLVQPGEGRWPEALLALHAFAEKLGLQRAWFQPRSAPHYDLTPNMRSRALLLGAKEVGDLEAADVVEAWLSVPLAARKEMTQ